MDDSNSSSGNFSDDVFLAERFEAHRGRLRGVAYRMLGSSSEADDAVQEAWLRLNRSDASEIENLGGWLTTVVGRVCLNMLQARKARREEPLEVGMPEVVSEYAVGALPVAGAGALGDGPEDQAVMADSLGVALLVVLETLTPAERLVFVLHDLFAVPFDEIAPIVEKSPAAARQLASRARRRVQGTDPDSDLEVDVRRKREIVDAFLAASRGGDFDALLRMLDPSVVLRADAATVSQGAEAEVSGARAVAETFSGRAKAARLALIDGSAGAVWSMGGTPRVVFGFTIEDGVITAIELIGDPTRIAGMDLEILA